MGKNGTTADKTRIEYMPLSELQRWPRNPKAHDLGALHTSINRFGFVAPITVDERTGKLVAGHGRLDALQQMKARGAEPPARIEARGGEWYVPVVRGVSFNSDFELEAYLVADNRTTELGGWEQDALAALLSDLAAEDAALLAATGYDADDLDALLAELGMGAEAPDDPGAQIDRAAELLEVWGVERGDVWEVPSKRTPGRAHRVMCGDSTDAGDVATLMDGEKAALLLTDPPYGISVVKGAAADSGGSKPVTIGTIRARRTDTVGGVKNRGTVGAANMVDATLYRPVIGDDKPFDPTHLLGVAENAIVFGGNYFASKLPDGRCWIVWDKDNTGNFADAELAWTDFDRGVRLYKYTWNGLVREGSRNLEGVKRWHPTQKPAGLMGMIVNDFTDADALVLDLYMGSGSVLVATECTGRIGYGMEIDPAYVAVTLQRLADMGLEPRRVEQPAEEPA